MSIPPCHLRHSTKAAAGWQRGDDESPGLINCANGAQQVKMRCNSCGFISGALPHRIVAAWRIRREDIAWTKVHAPAKYEPCVVKDCGTIPTEMHHFAPRNTFDTDADAWPVLPLCREHHREWHQRMDGYRWHAPRPEVAA